MLVRARRRRRHARGTAAYDTNWVFQTFAVGCSVLAQKVLMEGECCCAASPLDASVLSIDGQYDGAPCRYPDTRPRGCATARGASGRPVHRSVSPSTYPWRLCAGAHAQTCAGE